VRFPAPRVLRSLLLAQPHPHFCHLNPLKWRQWWSLKVARHQSALLSKVRNLAASLPTPHSRSYMYDYRIIQWQSSNAQYVDRRLCLSDRSTVVLKPIPGQLIMVHPSALSCLSTLYQNLNKKMINNLLLHKIDNVGESEQMFFYFA